MKVIIPYIPDSNLYCEPFCGGASIYYNKRAKATIHVLNDTNHLIVNFYRVLRDRTKAKELIRRIKMTPCSREEFQECRRINKSDEYDDITQAWAFWNHITMGFSNKMNAGFGYQVAWESSGSIAYYKKIKKENNLRFFISRLKECFVEQLDAIECINKYDSVNAFFYVDPPYVGADQGHYAGYTENNYKDLIACLEAIKGQFILSHYHTDLIPETWNRKAIQTYSSAAKDRNKGKDTYDRVEWLYSKTIDFSYGQKALWI